MGKDDFREWLTNLYNNRENYIEYIRNLADQCEYTVFYGCGVVYNNMMETWNKYIGRPIDFCCDRDPNKWGKSFNGIKCISPEELSEIKDCSTVFITTSYLFEAYEYLKAMGIESISEIYKYNIIISDELDNLEYEKIDKIFRVYSLLSDEKSQKVFIALIKRVFDTKNNRLVMLDLAEKDQYFPADIVKLSDHESFVDAGAYSGDTLVQFLNIVDGEFNDYYAFELDEKTFGKLKTCAESLENKEHIKLFNQGLWNEERIVNYSSGNLDSSVGSGDKKAFVVRLDDVLENSKVTFIKMDIEGAELNALEGAENIIRLQKPVLAICVYHKLRDIWEIPLYIKSLYPEYKIYFRHHTDYEYETVCYAIPEGNS